MVVHIFNKRKEVEIMKKFKKGSIKLIASMIAVIILISPINVLAAVITPKGDELLHSDEYIGASDAYLANAEVNKKITKYISKFNKEISENNESNKRLKDSMYNYLKVFKYPSVERVSYDRLEQLLNNQIAPYIGDKIISDITAVDIKTLINTLTEKGYAFSTVKKTI